MIRFRKPEISLFIIDHISFHVQNSWTDMFRVPDYDVSLLPLASSQDNRLRFGNMKPCHDSVLHSYTLTRAIPSTSIIGLGMQ